MDDSQEDDILFLSYGALLASDALFRRLVPVPRSYSHGFLDSLLSKDSDDFQRILRLPLALFHEVTLKIKASVEYKRSDFHFIC